MEQQNELKKRLISFILLALILTMEIIALLTYFFKVCLYFIRNIPFEINIFDLVRVIKGASFGGLIVGIGC